jgi:hypothetical protein
MSFSTRERDLGPFADTGRGNSWSVPDINDFELYLKAGVESRAQHTLSKRIGHE